MDNAGQTRFDRWLAAIMGFACPIFETLFSIFPKNIAEPLTFFCAEFLAFGIKQAWACLFGGVMLAGIIGTSLFYPEDAHLTRYDFLFLYAISIQVLFLLTKMEHAPEALVILIFHIVGTVMEIFKTDIGSWTYPEENIFRIGGVPMFSGFMYAAIGSYIARVMRIFRVRFNVYPPKILPFGLAILIYVNFFTHHYILDFRWALFAGIFLIYWRTIFHIQIWRIHFPMPILIGFFLVALFIWIAENIGTITKTWLYPNQLDGWHMVSLQKMGSWYLLMILSFILITLVHKPKLKSKSLIQKVK